MDQRNEASPLHLSYKPKVPILFLTNVSETGPIEQYIEKVKIQQQQAASNEMLEQIYLPALWQIGREGHNLVNEEERISAMQSLLLWMQFQTFITVRRIDNTRPPKSAPKSHPVPTKLTTKEAKQYNIDSEAYMCTIVDSNEVFGTFTLNIVEEQLKNFGIKYRRPFYLKILDTEEILEVRLAVFPFVDVPLNVLIAFCEPNFNYTIISQNTFEFKNLLNRYKVKLQDRVLLFS